MANIGKCTSCGHNLNEIWKELREGDECPSCGESITVVDVNMGTMDAIPRIFKYGGITLMLLAVCFVLYNLFGGGTKTSGILAVIIFIIAVVFFAVSLGLQYYLSIGAIRIEKERPRSRSTRKVRGRPTGSKPHRKEGKDGEKIKTEKIGRKIPQGRGTKIPVGRKWGRN